MFIFSILSAAFAQSTVTVTGTDLSPTFSPGIPAPIVSLSFSLITLTPMINYIKVDRTGTATNTDVPTAKLYRDVNKNNVVDAGDVQLDQTRYFQGTGTQNAYFQALSYYPSTSENLIIVYDIAAGANTSNTAGASMPAGYVTGGSGTVITFVGITTGNQPLPVELTSFSAQIQNKSVILEWKTATEVNNYGFEIERQSIDAGASSLGHSSSKSIWTKIGFVEGNGNSNSPKSYAFTDNLDHALALNLARLQYRLKQIDFDGSYKYSDIVKLQIDSPSEFVLQQNYPNPFNPSTTIKYEIPKSSFVKLSIFDLLGREIATPVNQVQNAGYHEITFNAENLASGISARGGYASGVYIYTINVNGFTQSKKMLLMK